MKMDFLQQASLGSKRGESFSIRPVTDKMADEVDPPFLQLTTGFNKVSLSLNLMESAYTEDHKRAFTFFIRSFMRTRLKNIYVHATMNHYHFILVISLALRENEFFVVI